MSRRIEDMLQNVPQEYREGADEVIRVARRELPETFETGAPPVDLRQQTYDLLRLVREPSAEEREALAKKRIVFLPIETKSYVQVVTEDPAYFWDGELEYASRPALRDYVLPVATEVGLKPTELALPGSFDRSQANQLKMIEGYSQVLQAEFPAARAIMLPVTGYTQADKAYKERTGELLFRNYFARALDMLSGVNAAYAGRYGSSWRFFVNDWDAGRGLAHVGAVPAVVFLRK